MIAVDSVTGVHHKIVGTTDTTACGLKVGYGMRCEYATTWSSIQTCPRCWASPTAITVTENSLGMVREALDFAQSCLPESSYYRGVIGHLIADIDRQLSPEG